jgi:hypothetical protein
MREKSQIWRFGMRTEEVPDFLAQYGWRVLEQASDHNFSAYTDHSRSEAPRSRPAGRMYCCRK